MKIVKFLSYICVCAMYLHARFWFEVGPGLTRISDNFGIAVLVFSLLSSCPLPQTSSVKRSSDVWKTCAKQSAGPYILTEKTIWSGYIFTGPVLVYNHIHEVTPEITVSPECTHLGSPKSSSGVAPSWDCLTCWSLTSAVLKSAGQCRKPPISL